MKEALSHILDQSVCLTRRQMKEYLAGTMLREEQHAAELHLTSCPLCSMAMEGFEEHSEEALAAIASLNSGFLKEHYDAVTPQIHLNSVAPAMTASQPRRKGAVQPLWRNLGIAASILLLLGVAWTMREHRHAADSPKIIADNRMPATPATAPVVTATPKSALAPVSQQMDRAGATGNTVAAAKPQQAEDKKMDASGSIAMADEARATAAPSMPEMSKSEVASKMSADSISTSTVVALGPNVHAGGRGRDISIGGGRTTGSAAIIDGVQYQTQSSYGTTATPPAAATKVKAFKKPLLAPAQRNDYYNNAASAPGTAKAKIQSEKQDKEASAAQLKDQMESGEGSRRSRHAAGIQSAKAYVAAGEKAKAIAVLNAIIAEGGPQKRAAKKMLKELQ